MEQYSISSSSPVPTNKPRRLTRRQGIIAAALLVIATAGVLVAARLLTGSSEPPSPLLADGGFEKPRVPAFTVATIAAGQSVGAWTVTQGGVDHIGPGYWEAAEGTQSVDLSGLVDGAVKQTFNTIPGATYLVEFFLAGNPDGAPRAKTGRAMVDGQVAKEFSFDSSAKTAAAMGFQKIAFSFTARGSQSTVEFRSTCSSPWGPVLDNVTVTMNTR